MVEGDHQDAGTGRARQGRQHALERGARVDVVLLLARPRHDDDPAMVTRMPIGCSTVGSSPQASPQTTGRIAAPAGIGEVMPILVTRMA